MGCEHADHCTGAWIPVKVINGRHLVLDWVLLNTDTQWPSIELSCGVPTSSKSVHGILTHHLGMRKIASMRVPPQSDVKKWHQFAKAKMLLNHYRLI